MKIKILSFLIILSFANSGFCAAMKCYEEKEVACVDMSDFLMKHSYLQEDGDVNARDKEGCNSLILLLKDFNRFLYHDTKDYLNSIDWLISRKVCLNSEADSGESAMYFACNIVHTTSLTEIRLRVEVITKLLNAGANPINKDKNVVFGFAQKLIMTFLNKYLPLENNHEQDFSFKAFVLDPCIKLLSLLFQNKFGHFKYDSIADFDKNWSAMKNFLNNLNEVCKKTLPDEGKFPEGSSDDEEDAPFDDRGLVKMFDELIQGYRNYILKEQVLVAGIFDETLDVDTLALIHSYSN